MFFRLPPAGELIPVPHRGSEESDHRSDFPPYLATYFGSGTEALAAALIAAVQLKGSAKAEVLIPAYTCPAVLSAVIYAGATPVLIDNAPSLPWMDLEQVAEKVSDQTAAVVAVDLFGIVERVSELQEIATERRALLIEDSAQRMLRAGSPPSQADMVTLSFGRGKPVSLLGGGATLTTDPGLERQLPPPSWPGTSTIADMSGAVQTAFYNFFLPPQRYWAVARIPLLQLGETRYLPLKSIRPMPANKLARLGPALREYHQRRISIHAWIKEMVAGLEDSRVSDLATACDVADPSQLSRYPLLFKTQELRDAVLRGLTRAGLGASGMYPDPLTHIPGLTHVLAGQGPFPEAYSFSKRVLTLPTHSAVREQHIDKMSQILLQALR